MSGVARANGWRGFDGIGERVGRRRFARVGEKKSGWLVCYGTDDGPGDDGKGNDVDVVLTFCPSCAAVVKEQDRNGGVHA